MAKYKAILIMTILAVIIYWGNFFILGLPNFAETQYDLSGMYSFFWICAALVVFAVYVVNAKSPDNTGYVFMGITLLQMGAAYFMVEPLLDLPGDAAAIERTNFFIVFILFLAIETVITIRLLNNKQ